MLGQETRCCSTSSERPEFFSKTQSRKSTNIIEQPPYSPDMAPVDSFLFPKLKLPLRGTCFQSIEDIKENSRRELKSIMENAFKKCFNDWIIRWHKCIVSGRDYFEGDKINLDELWIVCVLLTDSRYFFDRMYMRSPVQFYRILIPKFGHQLIKVKGKLA